MRGNMYLLVPHGVPLDKIAGRNYISARKAAAGLAPHNAVQDPFHPAGGCSNGQRESEVVQ